MSITLLCCIGFGKLKTKNRICDQRTKRKFSIWTMLDRAHAVHLLFKRFFLLSSSSIFFFSCHHWHYSWEDYSTKFDCFYAHFVCKYTLWSTKFIHFVH